VLGPPLAGFLFDQHYSLPTVSMVLALGTLIAAFILASLKLGKPTVESEDEVAAPAAGATTAS
jgi:hypothetical protein